MLDKIATHLCIILGCADFVLSVLYLFDKQPWKSLYWFAASLIMLAVLKMK